MKTLFCNHFPAKGYKSIALWPFIFVRKDKGDMYTPVDERHERIHLRQQVEMLFILFYLWYGIEYLVRAIIYKDFKDAYYNISFEQEAYLRQYDEAYLKKRKPYAWIKLLPKKSFKY